MRARKRTSVVVTRLGVGYHLQLYNIGDDRLRLVWAEKRRSVLIVVSNSVDDLRFTARQSLQVTRVVETQNPDHRGRVWLATAPVAYLDLLQNADGTDLASALPRRPTGSKTGAWRLR